MLCTFVEPFGRTGYFCNDWCNVVFDTRVGRNNKLSPISSGSTCMIVSGINLKKDSACHASPKDFNDI